MKFCLLTAFLCVMQFSITAQVVMIDNDDGNHSFISSNDNEDLHFYLFDDGYHSFEMSPNHVFEDDHADAVPTLYSIGPYEDEEIIGFSMDNPGSTTGTTIQPSVQMAGAVEVKASWSPVEDNENFFLLMFQNTSDETWNGSVEFHFHIARSDIESDNIQDKYNGWVADRDYFNNSAEDGTNRRYTWQYEDLEAGEQRFVYIPANCKVPAFTRIITHGVINNQNGYTESFRLNSTVSNFPHDPNAIIPNCDYLDKNAVFHTIDYRLYFHNEGNDPTQNVTVDFFTEGEYTNVTLLNSSADCVLEWFPYSGNSGIPNQQTHCAEIYFEDIFLPGDQQNPPAGESTHGWVDIQVCYDMSKYSFDDCLDTKIEILFDNPPPVIAKKEICSLDRLRDQANSQSCAFQECLPEAPFIQENKSIEQRFSNRIATEEMDFDLYPNPSSEYITLDGLRNIQNLNISVTDIHNRVQNTNLNRNDQIDISLLSQGLYYVRVQNGTEIKVKQFVKL